MPLVVRYIFFFFFVTKITFEHPLTSTATAAAFDVVALVPLVVPIAGGLLQRLVHDELYDRIGY